MDHSIFSDPHVFYVVCALCAVALLRYAFSQTETTQKAIGLKRAGGKRVRSRQKSGRTPEARSLSRMGRRQK